MHLDNQTSFEAQLIQGPAGPEQHGVAVIIKKTLPLPGEDATPEFIWPVSLQDLKTDLAEFPFDHHFPIAKMDMMVCGYAEPPQNQAVREMHVGLKVGTFLYEQHIFGDRSWRKNLLSFSPSDPEPFTRMPLTLAQAFGGTLKLEGCDVPCLENPLGKGFLIKEVQPENQPLPNIERPDQTMKKPMDKIAPTCMTPYPMGGKLRFDPLMDASGQLKPFEGQDSHLYFGQAHPDLMLERPPVGTEIRVAGMHPARELAFPVPPCGLACELKLDQKTYPLAISLDGICVFTHHRCVGYKYRAALAIPLEARQERVVVIREVAS